MAEPAQVKPTAREQFLEAASNELDAFERKESEFRKKIIEERAEQLRLHLGSLRNFTVMKPN